jgi:hypothetical protein
VISLWQQRILLALKSCISCMRTAEHAYMVAVAYPQSLGLSVRLLATFFCRHSPAAAQLRCLLLQQQQASAHPQWHPLQQPPRPLAATTALLLVQQHSLQTEGWARLGLLLQMVLLHHRLSGPLACS